MTTQVEAKITIAKLIEIAYEKNSGITTKLLRNKGNFKITVDENGNATLSGNIGMLTFKADSALIILGKKVKNVSIFFTKGEGGGIKYTAMFKLVDVASISVSGFFDAEKLIFSCGGLLCKAARALKGRHRAYDLELQRIMGH
ncbi:MAG: hypothetical protein P8011_05345 [Acidihalobacter sp.]|jgi:hypothetical protein|uniref:hypothetical protein n=1 Tax=Acidihalobacter sp. TaxID=1872108 RepID=UPI00307FB794